MAFTTITTSGIITKPHRLTHNIPNVISLRRRRPQRNVALFAKKKQQFIKINKSVNDDDNNNNNNHHHHHRRRHHQPNRHSPSSFLPNFTKTTRRQALLSALSLVTTTTTLLSSTLPPSPAIAAATTAAAAAAAISILKPPLDKRRYEFVTLDNGLRVLLCSDPSSSTAAAAMDVHVGATSDPVDVPGLAHFCEHMLFLGTERYPQEDSFSSFLSANGGSSNAFTDSENTVYFFDMDGTSNLREGLDRFGSFFSGPLFTEGATERELNAIESENAKNLQSDTFRLYQIEKSRANSHHPFSKFFTGNKYTLLQETKRKGINLRNELVNFYNKYYSANQMTLAIVAPQSIDTLKEWVRGGSGKTTSSFSAIPNRNVNKPEDAWRGIIPPYSTNMDNSIIPSLGSIVEMVPVSDIRRVMISWPIIATSPSSSQKMKLVKPDYYVAHLLGHEGPSSLLSYLKSKGWGNAVSCSSGNELSDFSTIELTVELTTLGLKRVERVVEAIFSYIKMLLSKTMADYHFDEVLNLSELEWRYMTKSEASGYVTSLATSMQTYDDPSLVIAGPRRLALLVGDGDGDGDRRRILDSSEPRMTFDSDNQRSLSREATLRLLSQLTTVDNAMITILSKSFEGRTNRKEYWYQTDYRYREISPALNAKWSRPREGLQAMDYPPRNEFIPTEEGLKVKLPPKLQKDDEAMTFEERMTPISPPKLVRDDERWMAYFKQDDRFGEPKAFVIFELLAKGVYETAMDVVLSMLYELSAADRLDEYTYSASLAGLSYNLVVVPRGIRLTFGGYNDKLQNYASYVTNKLVKDFPSTLPQNESEFDRYKDTISRSLRAFDVKQPYSQAIYYSNLAQHPPQAQFLNSQLRAAIAKATLSDLKSYVTKLFSVQSKGVALIQGNLYQNEALSLLDTIDATLGFTPSSSIPPVIQPLPLPTTNPTRFTTITPNPQNKNSVSQITFQSLSTTSKSHVLIQLLAAILEEPFYDDLRTKKQLGYIVSSGVKQFEQTRCLSLVVQSSIAPVESLTSEMMTFVGNFRERYLTPLKKGDFATYAKGLLDRKTEKDKTLAQETTRNWSEVINGRYVYDRVQREAKELLEVTKDDLLEFWDELIGDGSKRMFVSEVIPVTGDATSRVVPKTSYAVVDGSSLGSSSFEVDEDGMMRIGIDDIELFRKERARSRGDD